MYYPFTCTNPECGHSEELVMKMSEYTDKGHFCPLCKTEMKRDIKSMASAMTVDTTNTFYKKTTF